MSNKRTGYLGGLAKQLLFPIFRLTNRVLAPANLALSRADKALGMDTFLKTLHQLGYRPQSIFDIGAARGQWTRYALRYWPEASYLLVEPLEERRVFLNKLAVRQNVRYLMVAVGAEEGKGSLGISDHLDESSLTYTGTGDRQREIPITTIDKVISSGQAPPPDLMKFDIQGYERKALQGAASALSTCEIVILESQLHRFSPEMWLAQEAIAWMIQRGYRLYDIADIRRRPLDGALGEADLVFVKDHSALFQDCRWSA
jgi:FkbM family methyltransferase